MGLLGTGCWPSGTTSPPAGTPSSPTGTRGNTSPSASAACPASCEAGGTSRGAPPGLPFRWDVATLERGLNFTLTTEIGDLDLLGEIAGGGTYDNLLADSVSIQVFGIECRCLGLARLIQVKRAAGRVKDLEALAELEVLLEERRQTGQP